jgi:hypothetical protein
MGWSTAGDVRFDWDGSLRVARRLWALADDVDAAMAGRELHAEHALTDWLGRFGREFGERIATERSSADTVSAGLREGAGAWAWQWKSAMDEQNRRLHAREEQRIKDDRSLGSRFIGIFAGHDDLPPAPAEAGVPTAPGFHPTRGFARY